MPISHIKKIVFIHIPKNAGTSITTSEELGFSNVEHISFREYKKNHPFEWENYTKISIVRNPWDRFVSCYEYARMLNSYWHSNDGKDSKFGPHPDHILAKNICFDNFVRKFFKGELQLKHQCWVPQNTWICDHNKEIMLDILFKMESINDNKEFKSIFGEIDRCNKSKKSKPDYKDYYTSNESIDMIGEAYKQDLESFNYSF